MGTRANPFGSFAPSHCFGRGNFPSIGHIAKSISFGTLAAIPKRVFFPPYLVFYSKYLRVRQEKILYTVDSLRTLSCP